MEYMSDVATTQGKILCCQCGVAIDPNPSNMCLGCIRTQVDITAGIPKQGTLQFCKMCERYLQPPSMWLKCSLESKELLTLCMKRLKGLEKARLVDAGFVWTEPHSKRIKVKLTIQAEVLGGAILQQVFVVEFTIIHQMCDDCHRHEAKDFWKAVVQVRQKTEHKKTFYYLEQLIIKHKIHENTLGIKPKHDGLDFFYTSESLARKMVDFLTTVVPCRYQHSKKLISHDIHSNLYNYKFTFSVEIVPICKDSIVCLPKQLAHQLGGIGQICIVYRVTNAIALIDPTTAQISEVSSTVYWRSPFNAICGCKQLTEYTVMDVEVIASEDRATFAGQGALSNKHVPADVWVVRSEVMGEEDPIHCRSHLGHLLKPGDTVLGCDLANRNVNDANFEKINKERVPDIVLVTKVFGSKSARNRQRKWKLKHIIPDDNNSVNRDYMDFLEDLEEDPNYRQNINIYKDIEKAGLVVDDTDCEGAPKITLEEMIDDLRLDDEVMDQAE